MKKLFLLLGIVVMMGAGCSQSSDTQTSTGDQPKTDASTTTPPPAPQADGGLMALPAIDATVSAAVDASTWTKTTLRSGTTVSAPTKGAYAPTWSGSILASGDTHLQGDCYVTEATVYKRTDFAGHENVCLTTTATDAESGTRTDYFVFHSTSADAKGKETAQIQMLTFTKVYAKGFDMQAYSATLEKVIGLLD